MKTLYIKSDFVPTQAAEARLVALGFRPLSRMSGHAGWGNSITILEENAEEFSYRSGTPADAGRLSLRSE